MSIDPLSPSSTRFEPLAPLEQEPLQPGPPASTPSADAPSAPGSRDPSPAPLLPLAAGGGEASPLGSDAPRAALLSALLTEVAPDGDPGEAFAELARRGPPALRLLGLALDSPKALARALGREGSPAEIEQMRRGAGRALEKAAGSMVRERALDRLERVRQELGALIAELDQPGTHPRPRLERLFTTLEQAPWDERKVLLRALDLHAGSAWLQGDMAAFLFEEADPHKLDDPVVARDRLLRTGTTVFAGYSISLEEMSSSLQGRLDAMDVAETFVRESDHPLLALRPITRALAQELPIVERLHEQARSREGGAVIEAPRAWWEFDVVAGVMGSDVDLAETLLLAGLVDPDQVDLAEHRARFDVTLALASLVAPFPIAGVVDDLVISASGPINEVVGQLGSNGKQILGVHLGQPMAGWLLNQGFNMQLADLAGLPTNLMREAVQGDGRFDAPLEPPDDPPARP